MSPGYRLTPFAFQDIFEIWLYISKDSLDAADRVEAEIYDACVKLSRSPYLGKIKKRRTGKEVRCWTIPRFPNYIVIYYPDTKPIQVVAILHGRRNLERILRARTGK
ncbi:type II toxin-antitoxin system RelE/ParE family toxin [Terracidiphilus sp.]|uniref:type II toxin-antitoxin system RelE/ParE family toxin n=1 Tax=Terracidiphilus sp. TaxID=1964191 RepID=UPI003C753FAB